MSSLAVPVIAQTGGRGGGTQLLLLLVMAVVFYMLLIRPQQKRVREQRQLLSALSPGDKVITIGGVHGTILEMDDETVRLEVAPGTVLTFARQAIGRRVLDIDTSEDDEEPTDTSGSLVADETDVVSSPDERDRPEQR